MSEITEEFKVKETSSSTPVAEEEAEGNTAKKVRKLSSLKYRYFSGEKRRIGKRWSCLAQPPFTEQSSTKIVDRRNQNRSAASAYSHSYIKNLIERSDFYASDCNSHRDWLLAVSVVLPAKRNPPFIPSRRRRNHFEIILLKIPKLLLII